ERDWFRPPRPQPGKGGDPPELWQCFHRFRFDRRESFGFRSTPGAETGFPANGRGHRKLFVFPEDIPPIVEGSLPIWPDSTRSESGEKASADGIRPDRDQIPPSTLFSRRTPGRSAARSEEHTSELQSRENLVC